MDCFNYDPDCSYQAGSIPQTYTITIPEGITNIGNYAFCGGTYIENVYLPNTITCNHGVMVTGGSGNNYQFTIVAQKDISLDSIYVNFNNLNYRGSYLYVYINGSRVATWDYSNPTG